MGENGLKIEEFAYTTQKIRMVEINDEPWFVLKDVCDIFGVLNHFNISRKLPSNEKRKVNVNNVHNVEGIQKSRRGNPNIVVVNEPGLYRTIFSMTPRRIQGPKRSEIEERIQKLETFKTWVYKEVLPSIRKTGQYVDTEKKFDKFCPVKFDRAGCYEIARRKICEQGLNNTNANLLWRQWYIDFSKEIGFNIDTKAKQEKISKIEWLEKHGLLEDFCKFIEKEAR